MRMDHEGGVEGGVKYMQITCVSPDGYLDCFFEEHVVPARCTRYF